MLRFEYHAAYKGLRFSDQNELKGEGFFYTSDAIRMSRS